LQLESLAYCMKISHQQAQIRFYQLHEAPWQFEECIRVTRGDSSEWPSCRTSIPNKTTLSLSFKASTTESTYMLNLWELKRISGRI
jgi:hypothetical protein